MTDLERETPTPQEHSTEESGDTFRSAFAAVVAAAARPPSSDDVKETRHIQLFDRDGLRLPSE